jgi:hypothetical protein
MLLAAASVDTPQAYNHVMHESKLVLAKSCRSRPEAELAKGALEEAGIVAMIQADSVGGMRDHLAWSGEGFRLLVREEDAAAAREVLSGQLELAPDDSDGGRDPDFPTWRRFT